MPEIAISALREMAISIIGTLNKGMKNHAQ
jgi:hypothetical protein